MQSSYRSIVNPNPMIEQHKEEIELKYLKRKTLFVNGILMLLIAPVIMVLYYYEKSITTITIYGLFFVVLLGINFAFYAYEDYFNSLKLAMYITTLAIYAVAASLIIEIQSPSIFTILFLAYAVVSVYQDKKASLLNNFGLFFMGAIIVWRYPNIFETGDMRTPQIVYVYTFLLIFVALLSISSFVLIKRKTFFYHQLSQVKETEIRTINVVQDLKQVYSKKKTDYSQYYRQLVDFSDELSQKIKIDNIFLERITIIKDFDKLSMEQMLKKYPDYNAEDLIELKRLRLSVKSRMNYLLYKSSQASDPNISKRELFSETQFKSLKHTFDSSYAKIIAFCVFYTMLKVDNPFLKQLDDQEIRKLLKETDFFHVVDSKILRIYLDNYEVFDKIVADAFEKKVTR